MDSCYLLYRFWEHHRQVEDTGQVTLFASKHLQGSMLWLSKSSLPAKEVPSYFIRLRRWFTGGDTVWSGAVVVLDMHYVLNSHEPARINANHRMPLITTVVVHSTFCHKLSECIYSKYNYYVYIYWLYIYIYVCILIISSVFWTGWDTSGRRRAANSLVAWGDIAGREELRTELRSVWLRLCLLAGHVQFTILEWLGVELEWGNFQIDRLVPLRHFIVGMSHL